MGRFPPCTNKKVFTNKIRKMVPFAQKKRRDPEPGPNAMEKGEGPRIRGPTPSDVSSTGIEKQGRRFLWPSQMETCRLCPMCTLQSKVGRQAMIYKMALVSLGTMYPSDPQVPLYLEHLNEAKESFHQARGEYDMAIMCVHSTDTRACDPFMVGRGV